MVIRPRFVSPAYFDDKDAPLTVAEIDVLCERLNCPQAAE